MQVKQVKTELQSLGLRVPVQQFSRKTGAGPAEGMLLFLSGVAATVSTASHYASSSPYGLAFIKEQVVLCKDDEPVMQVTLQPEPTFYAHRSAEGIPYRRIALKHGKDCLATTVFQKCIYWNSVQRCKFCGIELSLEADSTIEKKTPRQLSEVAQLAQATDGIKHVVLTTGVFPKEEIGIRHICDCADAIKRTTDLPIHVQIEPPSQDGRLRDLKESGVDTIGLHIESFDCKTLHLIAPAKAVLGLGRYSRAWEEAVKIFGVNQVSSFLLAGLGENPLSIIEGSEYLIELGVYPFIVPLRPIAGSILQHSLPPPPEFMMGVYEEVSDLLKQHDMTSKKCKAGCVRCGACSALPEFEE